MALSLTRKLGEYTLPAIGFGCMGLSAFYVAQSGCGDTADVYGGSEDLLGEWFRRTGKRSEIFLATKFGLFPTPDRTVSGEPEYMHKKFARSLERHGVDSVEFHYLHRLGAMAELVKVGLLQTTRELGVAVGAYSPLGRGLLTGQYKSPGDFDEGDTGRTIPRFSKENFPNVLKIVDSVKAVGDRYNATPDQVAITWMLAQGPDVIPIPGTSNIARLKENLGAAQLATVLTSEDIEEMRKVAERADNALSPRYSPGHKISTLLFGDTPVLTA